MCQCVIYFEYNNLFLYHKLSAYAMSVNTPSKGSVGSPVGKAIVSTAGTSESNNKPNHGSSPNTAGVSSVGC